VTCFKFPDISRFSRQVSPCTERQSCANKFLLQRFILCCTRRHFFAIFLRFYAAGKEIAQAELQKW